ncbi:MAG: hypothetical protein V9E81_09085 [Marmoricola sp.]
MAEVEDDVEELAVQILQTQPSRDVALPALLAVARTDTDVESLQRLLDAGHMHEVELTKQVRWAIVRAARRVGRRERPGTRSHSRPLVGGHLGRPRGSRRDRDARGKEPSLGSDV